MPQNYGGKVLANYGSMIQHQQMAPTNNGNCFAMGNLHTGGMVKAPRVLGNKQQPQPSHR